MSNGLRTVWEVGPREMVVESTKNDVVKYRRGKNGGIIIRQSVMKRLVPKNLK